MTASGRQSADASRCPSLPELTLSFVPFGLLLCAALLVPELLTPGGTPNLHWLDRALEIDNPNARPVPTGTAMLPLYRAILAIWLSTLLMIPALCLYALPARSAAQRRYALLFWTFSYLAYLVHFYYTAFVIFGGVEGTFAHMRPWIAGTNFFLTGWWTLDVLLGWLVGAHRAWVRVEQTAARTFIFLVYVVTDLFLRPTFVRYLGIALVVSVVLSLLVRLGRGAAAGADVPAPGPGTSTEPRQALVR
jgi:hypothetical protein